MTLENTKPVENLTGTGGTGLENFLHSVGDILRDPLQLNRLLNGGAEKPPGESFFNQMFSPAEAAQQVESVINEGIQQTANLYRQAFL